MTNTHDAPSSLQGTVHLIVGGSGGIGSGLARRLTRSGAHVVIAGRDAAKLESVASEIGAEAAVVDVAVVDATDVGAVDELVASIASRLGRLDGIANCVGSIVLKPAHSTSAAEWHATLATNLTTAFAVVRAGAKAMNDSGGSIVLFGTAAAHVGLPNHEAIAAAKAGVEGLARSAAATYASRRIRVNCVAPGLVRTPLAARITGNSKALEASVAMHALGRIGEADEVAAVAAFLLDPANGWITGQSWGVDGGLGTLRALG